MRNVKIALIGCGGWAKRKYLPYLQNLPNVEVVAVCELVFPEERAEVAEIFPNTHFYETLSELLANEEIDGAVVTLPHSLHLSRIIELLQHNIPVYTDKPAGVSAAEIEQIIEAEKQSGAQVVVGCQRRALPGYVELKKHFVTSKEPARWAIGTFDFSSYPNWDKTWRNDPKLSGDPAKKQGVLLDTGYHVIDSLLYILDFPKPTSVFAQANYHNYNVEADVTATIQFEDQFSVQITISRDMPAEYEKEGISIMTEGHYFSFYQKIVSGEKQSTLRLVEEGKPITELHFPKTPVAQFPIQAFLDSLQGEPIDQKWLVESSLPTLHIIDAAYESILNKTVVKL